MKKVLIFVSFLVVGISNAQEKDTLKGVEVNKKEVVGGIKCASYVKETKQPLWVVNNKIVSYKNLKKIDLDKITEMIILKDKEAIKKFGKKGENGVVIITTK